MNQDVGELLKRIQIGNPLIVGAIASLVLVLVLSGITLPAFIRGRQDQSVLREQYESARARLEQLEGLQSAQPEQLRQRLAEQQAKLATALQGFPTKDQVSAEMTRYYQYASETGAQLVRLEAVLSPPEEVDQPGYDVQRFVIEARGKADAILRFFSNVGGGPFPTLMLDNINVMQDGPATGEGDLTIYSSAVGSAEMGEVVPEGTPGASTESSEILQLETLMQHAIAQKDWAAAVAHGRHILELAPGRQNVIDMLYGARVSWAAQLAAEGNTSQAREQYEEALQLVPDGQEALEGLQALGDHSGARSMPSAASAPPTESERADGALPPQARVSEPSVNLSTSSHPSYGGS